MTVEAAIAGIGYAIAGGMTLGAVFVVLTLFYGRR